MAIRVRELAGWVMWDGSNADELKALAGDRFEGVYDTAALVRNNDGHLVHVQQGWIVSTWKGVPGVVCWSPGAWRTVTEEAA